MKTVKPASRRQVLSCGWKTAMAAAAVLLGMSATTASAESGAWPSKPIRMIVPFPAGSFTDTVARVVSDHLSKSLGQPVIVENKAGANGLIGSSEAARAAPDGYTLVLTNSSSITINPQIYKKSNYKAQDFAPVTLILEAPFILATNPEWSQKNSVRSVKDLVRYASENPGKVSYGSAGPGNIAHLSFAMLNNRTKIDTVHVPYKSAAAAQMAVISGELQTAFDTWSALPQIRAGKLKPIAVSSSKRMTQLPDVPTVEEAGISPFDVTFWIGMLAPAGTPPQAVQKLHAVMKGLLEDEKARTALSQQGELVMADPRSFASRIEKEQASWKSVIQREGITLD
ncbi:tripartite tricarboxylate transporter substrate binding protein [Cupriavidus sp. AU9028]|uniref:Bug family tripartite tricarboxylate transporter substrate binding protein n=1 Tax=Cupriavidus sp. AU9028 TaxID=2871157 RepID=UPI001C952883|nr:tripartite tricarboxylate transporter substrate binding protein [Cupriavidus sp. AU9028]MBY4897184.1 tripartite tricarboxylate transporter substrate binding protein [Cupriavidus sp. AU9028]